jgi:hypothetical protein
LNTDSSITLSCPSKAAFRNSHYGLGERFLGSDGTVERVAGATDMVTGKSQTSVWYFPEKLNRAGYNARCCLANQPRQSCRSPRRRMAARLVHHSGHAHES